jgi:ParB family chromosome partitioning protein
MTELISGNLQDFDSAEPSAIPDEPIPARGGTRRIKSAKWIPIEKIQPDPAQPRRDFNDASLAELAQSIGEYGVRQPIVVEHVEEGESFQIVSGERRYRASKSVGLVEMPCIIQEQATQVLRFAQQLVENIHREDLSPIDKARALLEYKAILGDGNPWSEVEQKVGISETRRKQFTALLNLPEAMQKEIVATGG